MHAPEAQRDMDIGMGVASARFEQQHARGSILAQTVGKHTARRARTDDDVIVSLVHAWRRPTSLVCLPKGAR
jgi:hypothetical protein